MPKATIREACDTAGVDMSKRSYYRYVDKARAGKSITSDNKASGRPSTLNDDQKKIVAGFVLHRNVKHVEVGRADVCQFINDQFGVVVTHKTAGNILAEQDLTLHVASVTKDSFKVCSPRGV